MLSRLADLKLFMVGEAVLSIIFCLKFALHHHLTMNCRLAVVLLVVKC